MENIDLSSVLESVEQNRRYLDTVQFTTLFILTLKTLYWAGHLIGKSADPVATALALVGF